MANGFSNVVGCTARFHFVFSRIRSKASRCGLTCDIREYLVVDDSSSRPVNVRGHHGACIVSLARLRYYIVFMDLLCSS